MTNIANSLLRKLRIEQIQNGTWNAACGKFGLRLDLTHQEDEMVMNLFKSEMEKLCEWQTNLNGSWFFDMMPNELNGNSWILPSEVNSKALLDLQEDMEESILKVMRRFGKRAARRFAREAFDEVLRKVFSR